MSEQPVSNPATAPDSWADGPLLGFDTETTGVSPTTDRLVTAALVARGPRGADGARPQRITTWLADPGVEIPDSASAVHGISTARARAEGRPVDQVLEEVAAALTQAMSAGTPVVAYNAAYDLALLETELVRHGLPTVRQRLGRELGPVVDPLVIDRRVNRYRKGKRRLTDLCAFYGVDPQAGGLHTAEVDVVATLDVLDAMAYAHPEIARIPRTELMSWQAAAHRDWAVSFNEFLRRRGRTPDVNTSWPLPDGM
ncbi:MULTISPECIES: exonuclease domain-containing protein [unclassified Actinomyces]|uniref:exonuclease domain-containing protein n=1 Tax=unclassified Actinomyces TaxID=2609248 RepID=UPI0013A68E1A|nr:MULTISPECIES: exonuclease domain-containing protein [unclassified Actinomyces]MBW3069088.1 DNA polymerase III subunit epsilon [Actinomyces sp. 594]NDR54240.1 DNA polymerase III subunit epsilon [Actinomyces sp. 565]